MAGRGKQEHHLLAQASLTLLGCSGRLGPNPDNPNQKLCDEHGNILPDTEDEPVVRVAAPGGGWLRNLPNVPLLDGLRRRLLGPGQPELQGA